MDAFIMILGFVVLIKLILLWVLNRNRKKIYRSDISFNLIADNKCICSSVCNEYCDSKIK